MCDKFPNDTEIWQTEQSTFGLKEKLSKFSVSWTMKNTLPCDWKVCLWIFNHSSTYSFKAWIFVSDHLASLFLFISLGIGHTDCTGWCVPSRWRFSLIREHVFQHPGLISELLSEQLPAWFNYTLVYMWYNGGCTFREKSSRNDLLPCQRDFS